MVEKIESTNCSKTCLSEQNVKISEKLKCISNQIKNNHNYNLTKELIDCSYDIYKQGRDDSLSELKMFYGFYMLKNIFFEISSYHEEYLNRIIDSAINYNYTVMILYPFTSNIKILGIALYKEVKKKGEYCIIVHPKLVMIQVSKRKQKIV